MIRMLSSFHVCCVATQRPADNNSNQASPLLAPGAQVWISIQCSFSSSSYPTAGAVFARVLTSIDGAQYTAVGYDFGAQALFVDHTFCCAAPNSVVQRAPAPIPKLNGLVNITGMRGVKEHGRVLLCMAFILFMLLLSSHAQRLLTVVSLSHSSTELLPSQRWLTQIQTRETPLRCVLFSMSSTAVLSSVLASISLQRTNAFYNNALPASACSVSSWQMASVDPPSRRAT